MKAIFRGVISCAFIISAGILPGQQAPTPTPAPTPVPTPVSDAASQPAAPVADAAEPTTATEAAVKPTIVADPKIIPNGFVGVLYGKVEGVKIKLAGKDPWIDAAVNMAMPPETELQTARGKTKLWLMGQGQLRIPPNTYIKLRMLNEKTVAILVQKGKIWSQANNAPGISYVVQTPDLAAGVRGGLFSVEVAETGGSQVKVFEGLVRTQSSRQPTRVNDVRPYQGVNIDRLGAAQAFANVSPDELKEWNEWDQWALDVHEQIGKHFTFGGQAIDNLAKLQAQDMKKIEGMAQEAEANITANREGDHVDALKKAFLAFYKDTGHQPTKEEGFRPLVENIGQWPTWRGPYLQGADAQLPPMDRWGSPIVYTIIQTPGGKFVPAVVSNGPNKVFSKGRSDDIMSYVLYNQVRR